MTNIWQNAVITNKGRNLLAKLVGGTSLTITRAVTGAGYVTPSLLPQQTKVSTIKQTLQLRPATYPDLGEVCVSAYLENNSLSVGYTALQVGIYAQDPDEGEILYFIAQASGTGTVIPSGVEMPGYSAEWNFYFTYGQADNVTVTVSQTGAVSREELNNTLQQKAYLLTGGTAIPYSADLNDYRTIGNYYCASSTTAATVAHSPTPNAFILKVEHSTGTGYPCQVLREYSTGAMYYRYYTSSNTWTAWREVAAPYDWTNSSSVTTYLKVYVGPNGSDDNPGTQASPMATIKGTIRKFAATNHVLDIYMLDGTYNEEIGTIAVNNCDIAIRSNSQNVDSVTINMSTEITMRTLSLRLYNLTLNMTATGQRPICVDNGTLYAHGVRISVPAASNSSCVNVYNGSQAFLYQCILNSGTGNNAGACAYGNQAQLIRAISCTSERTVTFGFFATNGANIEYTPTVTATTMTKETNLGKCYAASLRPVDPNAYLPLTGGTMSGSIDVESDDFRAIAKRRTINGTQYMANYGCGVLGQAGVACIELQQSGDVLGRVEIGNLGLTFVDNAGKRTYLVKPAVADSTTESTT